MTSFELHELYARRVGALEGALWLLLTAIDYGPPESLKYCVAARRCRELLALTEPEQWRRGELAEQAAAINQLGGLP